MNRPVSRIMGGMIIVFMLFSGHAIAQNTTLEIWSHWGAEPVKVAAMTAIAAEFAKATGVQVNFTWIPKPELVEKLPLAFDMETPDLAYIDMGFAHPRIVRSLMDLTDLKFPAFTYPGWGLGSVGDKKNNFLPFEGISGGIYYNKNLFAQAGIVLPQDRRITAQEFIEIVKTLRAAGITPISEGSSNRTGKFGFGLMNTIFRCIGPERIYDFCNGQISFSDPAIVQALNIWQEVIDAHGYDPEKAASLTMEEGIFEMVDGNAAMNFCGTWIYSKFGQTERDQGLVGVLDWFTVDGGKGNDAYELGWGAGYGINRNSPHVAEAKKFLEFLISEEAGALWIKNVQAPYPVMVDAMPPTSLYTQLSRFRANLTPVSQLFAYPSFGGKAASNMWEEEILKFITGKHRVPQVIDLMNSRLLVK